MSDQNALAVPNTIIHTMADAERAASVMQASGFFGDVKQAAQAVVKILAGQELGFGPFASMTGVNIIQNKPVLAANLMAAAVKRTGKYNYRVVELTDTACELSFLEGGKVVGTSRFTWDDAKKADLTNKDNWRKYPRNMMFARALSNGQKWYCPDVFNGATVYTPDELGATVDEDGAILEGVTRDVTPPAQPPTPEPVKIAQVTTEAKPPANGKKPQPKIKTPVWFQVAAELAATFEECQDKDGKANNFHLLGAVAGAGFTEITDANLEDVKAALIDHMLTKRADIPAA